MVRRWLRHQLRHQQDDVVFIDTALRRRQKEGFIQVGEDVTRVDWLVSAKAFSLAPTSPLRFTICRRPCGFQKTRCAGCLWNMLYLREFHTCSGIYLDDSAVAAPETLLEIGALVALSKVLLFIQDRKTFGVNFIRGGRRRSSRRAAAFRR